MKGDYLKKEFADFELDEELRKKESKGFCAKASTAVFDTISALPEGENEKPLRSLLRMRVMLHC